MRFLTKIREIITPNQNILYLGIESIILSILVTGLFYAYISITNFVYLLPVAGIFLIFLTRVVTVEPDKWRKERYTMEFSLKHTILSFIASLVPAGVVYYQFGRVDTVILSILLLLVYSISLYKRSRKYLGELRFFTDDYSNVSQEWDMSAVALEKAIQHYDKGNKFRTHYWASRAISYYDQIAEKEERLTLREAASEFSAGCELLTVAVLTEGNESYSYYRLPEELFDEGKAALSERICDNCGRRRGVDRCKRIIDDDKRYVYCNTCRKTDSRANKQKGSSHNRRKRNRNESAGRRSRQDPRNTNQTNSETDSRRWETTQKNRPKKSGLMSNKKALNILGISKENPSKDDVQKAFRRRIKESHPDTGGSEEEFKSVKKAREHLISK